MIQPPEFPDNKDIIKAGLMAIGVSIMVITIMLAGVYFIIQTISSWI